MYKLSWKQQKDKIKIISKISGITKVNVSEYEYLCMMRDYRIAIPVSYTRNKLVYEIPYYIPLSRLLQSYINEELFFRIVTEFVQVVSLLSNCQLSINNLLLDMDYVFIDPTGQYVMFIYQPLFDSEAQSNVFFFLQSLTNQAILPAGESVERMKSFRRFLDSQQYFSEAAFMDFLEPKQTASENYYAERTNQGYDYSFDGQQNGMYARDDRTVSIYDMGDEVDAGEYGTTAVLGISSSDPSLERLKNGEKVLVNRQKFKIGSDRSKVDYWISKNKAVSRVHAIITAENDKYTIQDNKSTNCSYLNGNQLIPGRDYELHSGDRITLADEEFEFVIR